MSMSDLPTPEEKAAAARRYGEAVQRGQRIRRRRRILAGSGAGAAVVALVVALSLTLPPGKQATKVKVISPTPTPRTIPPPTSQRTGPLTTATSPSSATSPTTEALGRATTELNSYLTTEAARDQAAAQSAGVPWNGYLHTTPVADAGGLVAVAAFSYEPNAKPLWVLGYTNGQWQILATLSTPPGYPASVPPGAAMNSNWLTNVPGTAIAEADVTGDRRPDFLIPLTGADNIPGAVVSQDDVPGGTSWRYIPYTQGTSSTESYEFARSPQFQGNSLVTTYDNCSPNCAQGTNYTVTWTYKRNTGHFWAPNPP